MEIWQVAKQEIASLRRDGRLRIGVLLGTCLLMGLTLLSWQTWRAEEIERLSFESTQREQWENQGEKHPHRAAHFGFYLEKPELPLALFDSGVKPVTGQTLWLEAHTRSSFSFAPLEDAGAAAALGLTNGAEALQLLGPLLVIVAAYGSVAREREDGTLRLVLAQGISPLKWFLGKYLGLAGGLSFVSIPLGLGLFALCYFASPSSWDTDTVLRGMLMAVSHFVYLAIWLAIALSASACSRNARQALAALFALWILGGILAPRIASFTASSLDPTPSVANWKLQAGDAFGNGLGDESGWSDQLAELERVTLDKYNVDTLDELPVGFSGIRMLAMSAFSDRISDHFQGELEDIYAVQEKWRLSASLLGPYLAMRNVSQGMAGMDWAHYLHFADEAETYRRTVVRDLDQLLEERLVGDRWEIGFDREIWEIVPKFEYVKPDLNWSLANSAGGFAALGVWLVAFILFSFVIARRIQP